MRRQLTGLSLIVCGLWIIGGVLISSITVPVASAIRSTVAGSATRP